MGSGAWGPAALLAVCLLDPHILVAEARIWPETDIPVTGEPSQPRTGDNLTLTPGGTLHRPRSCSWYRGQAREKEKEIISTKFFLVTRQKEGEAYTGRETAGPGCALHIRQLTALDSGTYTVEKKGLFRLEIGHAYVEVSDPYLPKLSPGIISGIAIGLLLAVTAAIGAFLYFFGCGMNQGSRWCSQPAGPVLAPAQPVSNLYQSHKTSAEATEAMSTCSEYEYICTGREEPQTLVKSGISPAVSREYQTLHVSRDVYHDLRTPQHPPPVPYSWPSGPC